jgi:hypothetical protein
MRAYAWGLKFRFEFEPEVHPIVCTSGLNLNANQHSDRTSLSLSPKHKPTKTSAALRALCGSFMQNPPRLFAPLRLCGKNPRTQKISAVLCALCGPKTRGGFAPLRLCGKNPRTQKTSAVLRALCGSKTRGGFAPLRLCGFLPILVLLAFTTNAFSQPPYLGGKGDGYASQFTQISAIQQSIAPAWMVVYPSPVHSGDPIAVTVFDVKAEVAAELYDALGKRLAVVEDAAAFGKVRLQLPTAGLAVGCYLLRVRRDGDAFTQKVMVWGE